MKQILLSAEYLELLKAAFRPGEIIGIYDFADFLNGMKDMLRAQGKDEAFNAIIKEEVHMLETVDNKFV